MCKHGHDLAAADAWLTWNTRDGATKRTCRRCNRAKQARMQADGTHTRRGRAGGSAAYMAAGLGAYGALAYGKAEYGRE